MLRTFYATSFLSYVGILRHDSSDGARENVNSYNVTTLGKGGELCADLRADAISLTIT